MIPDEKVRLTQMSEAAGCGAKIGPGSLQEILKGLPHFQDDHLLIGVETNDDGAVYKINEDTAIIQTLDFFPPVVDDPYIFGQVAAANALSDIYAMGGEPKLALNIVAWPNCLNPAILGKILAGGADKVKEAGAILAGGHSIHDSVPKYGLSVTGFVHPKKLFKNCNAVPGDVLILTKPLGTGIVNTAVKAGLASREAEEQVIQVMTTLNKKAWEVLKQYPIHSCTDVTGFGLAGHGTEMADSSKVTLSLFLDKIPVQKEAKEYAQMGLIPEGAYRNRKFLEEKMDLTQADLCWQDIIFDPQTSGGLLISADRETGERILEEFSSKGLGTEFGIIGQVEERGEKSIRLLL